MSVALADRCQAVVQRVLGVDEADLSRPFDDLDVDSFDLVELRAALEHATGARPADDLWVACARPADAVTLFSIAPGAPAPDPDEASPAAASPVATVGMPQMALGGLSEAWLFRDLGDRHWRALCAALGTTSDRIEDSAGNRLYATFVRVRWSGTRSLFEVRESDELVHRAELSRHGGSMYLSDATLTAGAVEISASLLTTFALRQGSGNSSLARGEPSQAPVGVRSETVVPEVAATYRSMRRGELAALRIGGVDLRVRDVGDAIWTSVRPLNPYLDINGVELLYFAAFPTIADLAEREWVRRTQPFPVEGDYALRAATIERDVHYYANCDLTDSITYHLLDWATADGEVVTLAALRRESDLQLLAHLATRRCLRG